MQAKKKKNTKVRDLKPKKDAKGGIIGARHNPEGNPPKGNPPAPLGGGQWSG